LLEFVVFARVHLCITIFFQFGFGSVCGLAGLYWCCVFVHLLFFDSCLGWSVISLGSHLCFLFCFVLWVRFWCSKSASARFTDVVIKEYRSDMELWIQLTFFQQWLKKSLSWKEWIFIWKKITIIKSVLGLLVRHGDKDKFLFSLSHLLSVSVSVFL